MPIIEARVCPWLKTKRRRHHNHKENQWKKMPLIRNKWLQTSATTKLHMQSLKAKKREDGSWKKLATFRRSSCTKNLKSKAKQSTSNAISRERSSKKMSPFIEAWWIGMSYKYSKNKKKRWRSCCKKIKTSIRIYKVRIWRHCGSCRPLKLIKHRRASRSGSLARIPTIIWMLVLLCRNWHHQWTWSKIQCMAIHMNRTRLPFKLLRCTQAKTRSKTTAIRQWYCKIKSIWINRWIIQTHSSNRWISKNSLWIRASSNQGLTITQRMINQELFKPKWPSNVGSIQRTASIHSLGKDAFKADTPWNQNRRRT